MKKWIHGKILLLILCMAGNLIQLHAQVTFQWARSIGGTSLDGGYAIAADHSGNVYTVGYFVDSIHFRPVPDSITLFSNGSIDAFVSKWDAGGRLVWVRKIGGRSSDMGYSITLDRSGNIYAIGSFQDTVSFELKTSTTHLGPAKADALFIVKLDPKGNFIWAKTMEGATAVHGRSVTTDALNNVFLTGDYTGTAEFNSHIGKVTITAKGNQDIFILKLDSLGDFVWVKSIGGTISDVGRSVAVDGKGNLYFAGYFLNNADADTTHFTSNGDLDMLIAKLDASGHFLWVKSLGGKLADQANAIAADTWGNIYVTGIFHDTVDFDPGPGVNRITANSYSGDVFILKLGTDGAFRWADQIDGTGNNDQGIAITTDSFGDVYTTGYYQAAADFDPGQHTINFTSGGKDDIFISKLDSSGKFLWATSMGGTGADYGNGIAVDDSGNVYTTGFFNNKTDFDPGTDTFYFTSAGQSDAFVHKMSQCRTFSNYNVVACNSFAFNGKIYKQSGSYTQRIRNAYCDSFVTIDLTIVPFDPPVITTDLFTLSTTLPYSSYQWLLNGNIIPGATDRTYRISQNGNYTVSVTNEQSCTGTSKVYTVNNYTGVPDIHRLAQQIRIYPNPAHKMVYIHAPFKTDLTITGITGKVIRTAYHVSCISVEGLSEGMYFLHVSKNGTLLKMEKLIKTR